MANLGNIQERWRPGHRNTMTAVEQERLEHTCIRDDGGTPGRKCLACEAEMKDKDNSVDPGKMEFFNIPQKKMGPGYYNTPEPAKEVRATDPTTGGEKGRKLQRFSLIPRQFLWELAAHYGKGALKYADRNWERGYPWSWSLDALERHLNAWLMGERYDNHKPDCKPDCTEHTGSHHLICAGWHIIALFIFDTRHLGTDDIRTKEMADVAA